VPRLEVADIFRAHGPTWRHCERGHLSLAQLKVMSAIEQCRSVALGGHALRCSNCAQPQIAYNSCRNRHCPKCQGSAAQRWLEARQNDLLPVEYYHVVFTLPARISALAYTNKELMYGLLFDIAAETLRTIAADPKHLGARIGATLVLHTWGSALTHHPHVHGIVPGGGLALDADGGSPVSQGSSCPCACSRACFVGASSKNYVTCIVPVNSSSSASTRICAIHRPSPTGSPHCASVSGWSMPSARSRAPKRYSPICRATHTA
jgi:hypothetical protein